MQSGVRFASSMDMGKKLRVKKARARLHWFERAYSAKHLSAVVPCHPDWSDLGRMFVNVQIRRMTHVDAAIGKVYRPFRIIRKAREELFSYHDHFIGLPACPGHSSGHEHILAFAEHSAKGVAREGTWRTPLPRHDHSRVQSPRQRHADRLVTIEISRQVSRENVPELLIKGFRLQGGLLLPLARLEVSASSLKRALAEHPV